MDGLRRRRERGQGGSATVEFALVLPLVLTMAVAVLQLGLFLKDQLVVIEAARAGARQGAVSPDDASVREATRDAAAVGLDPERLEVMISRAGGAGSPVTVDVVYHAPVVVPLVRWLFPPSVDLSGSAVMRQETE